MNIRPVTGEAQMDQAQMDQAQLDHAQLDHDLRHALLCRSSSRLVALPIASVVETMRPQPVQALPGLPGYVRGVAMIRGAGVPVVDLARLLGPRDGSAGSSGNWSPDRPEAPAASARFVTLLAGRTVALAVDAVVGVRSLDDDATGQLPPLLGGLDHGLVASLGALDPDLLYVLEASHLVDDELWQEIDAAAVQGEPVQGAPVQGAPVQGAAS